MQDDAEEEVFSRIHNKPPLTDADNVIIAAVVFQSCATFFVMLAFLVVRKRARWLYSPNTKNRPHHPCYGYTGVLNWMIPVATVSDTVLLSMIGLDAFMMLQTLKLLYRVLLILSVFVVPALGYLFWFHPRTDVEHSDQWLVRFSLGSLDPESDLYGFIVPVVYLVSGFIMYSIFVYYKRYIVLRQAYLRNPAIMTSITTLKKLSASLGSAELSAEYVNLPNRTLVLSRLPPYIKSDKDLLDFIDSLGVGEVEDCVLVHDTSVLQALYNERDNYIHNIEREISEKFVKMNSWSRKNREACVDSIEGFCEDVFGTVSGAGVEGVFDDTQKRQLAVIFLNGARQFENRYKDDVFRLEFLLDRLNHVNGEISREKELISRENTADRDTRIVELVSRHNSLFLRGDISQDASFFSLHHVLNCRKFKMYFTLDLPTRTKRGFVTFKDQRSANIVKQSQIGSRIFSVSTEDAPAPNDVIWENITRSEVENYVCSILGTVFFILFIILFSFVVFLVTTLLTSSEMLKELKPPSSFMKKHPAVESLIEGTIPPLIYNSMLVFVPTAITTLVNMEGIYSYSRFQKKLMGKLGNFLFFNGFVSAFFASSFFSLVVNTLFGKQKLYDVIRTFSEESLESSVFFANIIIQKSLFGTALVLLKPAPLIVNYLLAPFMGRKTRRQVSESEFSPPFDFGSIFPSCLIIFSMSITYTVICPPLLVLGAVFYLCNYLAFKSEFLYSTRNEYESGGEYWDSACQSIVFSLLFFQFVTFAKMSSDNRIYLSALLLPIIIVTFIFRSSLKKMFYKSCHFYPLNIKEEEYLDDFTERVLHDRVELLESWSEMGTGSDMDVLPVSQLGIKDTKEVEKESYYKDPNISASMSSLIFPENFFKTVWFLVKNDKKNVFELRTE